MRHGSGVGRWEKDCKQDNQEEAVEEQNEMEAEIRVVAMELLRTNESSPNVPERIKS